MKRLLINLERCNGCRDCELACAARQSGTLKLLKRGKDAKLWHPRISLRQEPVPGALISVERLKVKGLRFKGISSLLFIPQSAIRNLEFYVPFLCLHCEDAPCLEACISGAMRRDKKTGLISVDREQCVGCWSCIMVCPFGIINQGKINGRHLASKCDGCLDLSKPACVKFCEPEALVWLSPDEFTKSIRRQVVTRRVK